MTRTFRERIRCPRCGEDHTPETDFERWMRQCPELDSKQESIVRFDLDILLHKYRVEIEDGKGSRDLQCLMFVEVKTFMATPSKSQIDTLSMLNQVLRNRRTNIHGKPRTQIRGQPNKVHSKLLGKLVTIKMYGGHLLQMDDSSPLTSSTIRWDNKQITQEWLIDLLSFNRDPDRPEVKIDHRRRSQSWPRRLFQ